MENKSWIVHVEFLVLLITLLGGIYTFRQETYSQSLRSDRLYEMWVQSMNRTDDLMREMHGRICSVEAKQK